MHWKRFLTVSCLVVCCLAFSAMTASGQRYGGPPPGPYDAPPPPGPYGGPPPPPPPGQYGEQVLFNNGNIDAVQNGPSKRTGFTLDMAYTITFIQNYHYFNYGRPPGFIALRGADGRRYGPWPAVGEMGQGGVPNAYWNCYPNITIPPGAYLIEDSDPSTWSQNAASDYRGISQIRGQPAY